MYRQDIPDIEIIDLEDVDDALGGTGTDDNNAANGPGTDTDNNSADGSTGMDDPDADGGSDADDPGADSGSDADNIGSDNGGSDTDDNDTDAAGTRETPRRKKLPVNIHVVLLAVVVLTFCYIFYKYINFGTIVDPDENPAGADDYVAESYDNILALTDEEGNVIAPDLEDGLSIAIFGNGPFAEDRSSKDGLANLLAEETGATVYNCAIGGSYLASTQPGIPDMDSNPRDAFSFYWMSLFSTDLKVDDFFGRALETLGEDAPPEAAEVYELLSTLDFDTVDIIVVMYDASDYFAGHPACSTDDIPGIQSYAGNLEAGLEILHRQHPNTRIIVMSPTYTFSDRLDENGDYISSDIVRYGQDALSVYVSRSAEICAAAQVTFVDNFYVTFNEDNAHDYLRDNMHLNPDGRKRVVERLVYALHYYDAFYE